MIAKKRSKSKDSGRAARAKNFIERARARFGDRYDYSRVEYVNSGQEVIIGCPIHGWIKQKPYIHLITYGCPECGHAKQGYWYDDKKKQQMQKQFIKKSKALHEGLDYSVTQYTGAHNPVKLRCIKHDLVYEVSIASNHIGSLHQRGCPKCAREATVAYHTMPLEDFLFKAAFVHGDRYDYSKVQWVNANTEIEIICKEHGPFKQLPVVHINQKCGCPECGKRTQAAKHSYTQDEFIEMARRVHGDKYTYECTHYVGIDTPIMVNCRKHGPFQTTPHNFIHAKSGCPKCNNPKLESIVESWLKEQNIKYESQKRFEWLRNKRNLVLDFFLPDYNVAIECQGDQHFTHQFLSKKRKEYISKIGERDKMKHDQCAEHDIPIIYFVNKDSTVIPEKYFGPIVKDKIELIFKIHQLGK